MIGILPFVILLVLGMLVLIGWAIWKVIAAVRRRESVGVMPFVGTLLGGAFFSLVWAIVMALTVGLAHSRSISYPRTLLWSAPGTVILFIIPAVFLTCYQVSVISKKKGK